MLGGTGVVALASTSPRAGCLKRTEVLRALGEHMLGYISRSRLPDSPALHLPWESGLHEGRKKYRENYAGPTEVASGGGDENGQDSEMRPHRQCLDT